MAQLVTSLTLGFGSGHNFMVRGNKPHMELHADRVEPAWDSHSLSLSLSLPLPISPAHALPLSKMNLKKFF